VQIDEELDPEDVALFSLLSPIQKEKEAKHVGNAIAKVLSKLFG
jgi:hypothetical protein